MAGFTLKKVQGIEGEVTIPALGASIGTFAKWTLTRSEDGRSKQSEFTLRGAFSYLNPTLWADDSLAKRMTIRLGREGTRYLLVQKPDRKTVLEGTSIIMEGITLEPWPQEQLLTPINKDAPAIDTFDERKVEIRGTEFTIREMSAEEYDTALKSATKADGDIDTVLLLRLMTLKSLRSPEMTAEQISKLPYKVSRRLSTAVNELHFGDDEED